MSKLLTSLSSIRSIGSAGSLGQARKQGQAPVIPPVDPAVKVLAHTLYGAGFNTGSAPATGDGTQKTATLTTRNTSGAPISKCSIVLGGWNHRTTGFMDATATTDVLVTIEYPVGTAIASSTVAHTAAANTEGSEMALPTEIPNDAQFRISLAATPAAGQTYAQNLGLAGLRVHTVKSAVAKVIGMGAGDSLATNNGGSFYNAAQGRCPMILFSISGTLARDYAANGAAGLARHRDLAVKLGVTHLFCDWSINDFGANRSVAQVQADLQAIKASFAEVGIKMIQTTMTPRNSLKAAPTVSGVTSSGTSMVVTVSDTSLFTVGKPYVIAGATQTEYNGSKKLIAKDDTAKTLTFLFQGSATSPATGTITLAPWKSTYDAAWMQPSSTQFAPGPSSDRGVLNAWVRGGAFDGYIDWGDALEPYRDAGRFAVAGEKPELPDYQVVKVSSVISSTTRFNSNYSVGSGTVANGFIQFLDGANAGYQRQGSGNTNGDITAASSFPNAIAVNDNAHIQPGISYVADDLLHPRAAVNGKGGQALLDNATIAAINALLAA